MKTLLPCELSPQSPSLSFIRQFYVKQELCGLRRMETADQHGESWIGYQLLLLLEAVDEPLPTNQLRISSNLLRSDGESQGLEVCHYAVSYGSDSQFR